MLMYSANIYFWRRFKINYAFIFGFEQGTELGYREVLLLSSGLAVLSMAAVISNLDMEMQEKTNSFSTVTELVPLVLVFVSFKKFYFFNSISLHIWLNICKKFYLQKVLWWCSKYKSLSEQGLIIKSSIMMREKKLYITNLIS